MLENMALTSVKDYKIINQPKISFDPTHNDWTLGNANHKIGQFSPRISRSKKKVQKARKILTPIFQPFGFHTWNERFNNKNKGKSDTLDPPEIPYQLTLLNQSQVLEIEALLPSTLKSLTWTLSFSNQYDGFSLSTLYSNLSKIASPVLLVIQTMERNIIGAYSSCKLEESTFYYGSDDCFLFTFSPNFQSFKGNKSSVSFIQGTNEALMFGSDDPKTAGLWIDRDLCKGRTEKCKTFENLPLVPTKDFVIRSLECWTIG